MRPDPPPARSHTQTRPRRQSSVCLRTTERCCAERRDTAQYGAHPSLPTEALARGREFQTAPRGFPWPPPRRPSQRSLEQALIDLAPRSRQGDTKVADPVHSRRCAYTYMSHAHGARAELAQRGCWARSGGRIGKTGRRFRVGGSEIGGGCAQERQQPRGPSEGEDNKNPTRENT